MATAIPTTTSTSQLAAPKRFIFIAPPFAGAAMLVPVSAQLPFTLL